jgi:hypothetical protein
MSNRDLLLASFLVAVTLAVWAQAPDLPSGPLQARARTACLECHDAGIIVQQRLSRAAWTKEVDKMRGWGALVAPEDREAFIDYFAANFGVDKPPAAPDYGLPVRQGSKPQSKAGQ